MSTRESHPSLRTSAVDHRPLVLRYGTVHADQAVTPLQGVGLPSAMLLHAATAEFVRGTGEAKVSDMAFALK